MVPRRVAAPRVDPRDQHRQLDLDGVGVLELVDQQVAVAAVEGGADHTGVRAPQHLAGQHQQIVELELTGLAAFGGGIEREPAKLDRQPHHGCQRDLGAQLVASGADLLDALAETAEVVVVGPASLGAAAPAVGPAVVGEQAQLGVLVAGRLHPARPFLQLAQALVERVVVVGVVPLVAGARQLAHERVESRRPLRGLDGFRWCLGLGQVPVVVEGEGDDAQGVEPHPGRRGEQQRALDRVVGQQLVEKPGPTVVEGHRRRHLVEHLDPRRQPGLDGMLGEQPLGEAVQRADGGAVEVVEGAGAAVGHGVVAGAPGPFERTFELAPDAVAQLAGRLLGEGDRGDGVDPGGARGDDVDDASHELPGLARPRARIHEQRVVQRRGDAATRRTVGLRRVAPHAVVGHGDGSAVGVHGSAIPA